MTRSNVLDMWVISPLQFKRVIVIVYTLLHDIVKTWMNFE